MSSISGRSLSTKQQHSWNSGSGNAHMHTNSEEGSVCVSVFWMDDEGRVMKARKPLGGMSCDVTHGCGLRAHAPEGNLNSKQLRLICGNKTARQIVTRQQRHDSVSLFYLWGFPLFSLNLFTPHLSPWGTTPKYTRCCTAIDNVQYAHTHTHTHASCSSVPLLHSSCRVCFGYSRCSITVSGDQIVANWLFRSMNYSKHQTLLGLVV